MMSSPTKRFQAWTGPIRNFFNMKTPESTKRVSNPSLRDSDQITLDTESQDPDSIAEESFVSANVENNETVKTVEEQMEEAKEMYPGSKDWAKDEERLFEILYLRQDIPILPSHWNVDFRGFPIPEEIFKTSKDYPPRVYAHLKTSAKEYLATAALTRLIDLTLSVRTLIESHNPDKALESKVTRHRAANLIKDVLNGYLKWAARDGGYSKPGVVPNIAVEVVDAPDNTQGGIVSFLTDRMRAFGRLQREFYREDRSQSFWSQVEPWTMATDAKKRRALKNKRRCRNSRRKYKKDRSATPELGWDELSAESIGVKTPMQHLSVDAKETKPIKGLHASDHNELGEHDEPKPSVESDGDLIMSTTPDVTIKAEHSPTPQLATIAPEHSTPEPTKLKFRRKPPVVYGLYVIGTSVFLLTMDSSKGDSGYISFHVEINFADNHQSVWNALTVALAVCAARDELMLRLVDFDLAPVEESDSDPDA